MVHSFHWVINRSPTPKKKQMFPNPKHLPRLLPFLLVLGLVPFLPLRVVVVVVVVIVVGVIVVVDVVGANPGFGPGRDDLQRFVRKVPRTQRGAILS